MRHQVEQLKWAGLSAKTIGIGEESDEEQEKVKKVNAKLF